MSVGIVAILFFLNHKNSGSSSSQNHTKLQVVTSFYPLEYFSEQVGGKDIEIVTLTPSGGEPHDYEPTPQDIIKVSKSDIFVINGIVEPWAQRLLPQLEKEKTTVVKMSDYVDLLNSSDQTENIQGNDPHFWLDPISVQAQVRALRDAFMKKDPVHADHYKENAQNFIQRLADLDVTYKQALQNCEKKEIVTSHNAFAYLSYRYGFTVYSVAGFSPQEEPSPKHVAELTEVVKAKNIQYIFTEVLASSKFSDAVAQEAHVQTLVLNPIEGLTKEQRDQGENYDLLMRQNLQNLRLALQCPNLNETGSSKGDTP